jgi:HK97 family phage major capsid protein
MATLSKEQLHGVIKDIVGPMFDEWKKELSLTPATDNMGKILSEAAGKIAPEDAATAKGLFTARIIRAIAAGKGDAERAAAFAKKNWSDENVAKALSASEAVAGGLLIDSNFSTSLIELLRPASVFRRMNPVVVPMENGTLTMPGIATGATGQYIGENTNIPNTEQTFRHVNMVWKKLAALTPVSNDLLRFQSIQADQIVRDDLVAAIAQRSDLAFIRDDGNVNTPKGLRYQAPAANVIAANATVNLANVTTDLGKIVLKLMEANVRMLRPGWLMAPRTFVYLATVRDANGNFAYRDELNAGRLWGFPFGVTTQIPVNLGGGTNESELYFCDFADVMLGEASTLIVDASTEAAYHNGSAVVASFSLDQTVIRALVHHDLGIRHPESIVVMTGVTWTP